MLLSSAEFYKTAFRSNVGLFDEEEQRRLQDYRVAIPGLGGVGGIHMVNLLRMGVGHLRVADADAFELHNFNRQYGATTHTLNQSKCNAMIEIGKSINPFADIDGWERYVTRDNVDEFLKDVDIVIDGVDAFNIDDRVVIYNEAHARGIPVISAGPIGFSCSMIIQCPRQARLVDYLNIKSSDCDQTKFLKFVMGLCPAPKFRRYMKTDTVNVNNQSGPSCSTATLLCAGVAGTQVARLCKGLPVKGLPQFHYYDPYLGSFICRRLLGGNRNPIQKFKMALYRKLIA